MVPAFVALDRREYDQKNDSDPFVTLILSRGATPFLRLRIPVRGPFGSSALVFRSSGTISLLG